MIHRTLTLTFILLSLTTHVYSQTVLCFMVNQDFVNTGDLSEMGQGYCLASDNEDSYLVVGGIGIVPNELKVYVEDDGDVVVINYNIDPVPSEPYYTHKIKAQKDYGPGPYRLCVDLTSGKLRIWNGNCEIVRTLYRRKGLDRDLAIEPDGRLVLLDEDGDELWNADKFRIAPVQPVDP